ncbi:hypothetical protein [Staphylococcus sp. LKG3-3]|uniref:hypothetical protein n=1 Tax=Staphylococcus sp. LKG3-3 TaxID=3399685 RepID=UPI003D425C61
MAYKYEGYIKNTIRAESVFNHEIEQKYDRILELEEVYRKAKAFDEILKIDNQATDEDRVTGQYESDIETVLSEYKERD